MRQKVIRYIFCVILYALCIWIAIEFGDNNSHDSAGASVAIEAALDAEEAPSN